ncbi:MAG: alpha/beta hydrolase [Alphaproteobacteria bacterium]|nr:alpha/beta hydrolase [Alphaproteobacteria bacterium]
MAAGWKPKNQWVPAASHDENADVPITKPATAARANGAVQRVRAKARETRRRARLRGVSRIMTLSAEEYRDHLATTAVRAGFSFGEVALPSERILEVGDLRFRYLDWGTEGLRPILFLHGGALTAHTWDLCCLALRDGFHCLALDQRGHGDSDWAPDADYSIGAQREDVRGFADRLGLDRFVLVGQSMGAINGLAFAVAHPERLSALVMIDAGPEVRRRGSHRIRDFVNGSAKSETLDEIIARALTFNPRRDPQILRRSLMHNLRQEPDGSWRWKYDRRRFQRLDQERHLAERRSLADGLAGVTCPVLVVRGADSDVFHEEDAIRLAQNFPDGRHVTIPEAGHTVQGDNPKELVAALREFLG